MTRKNAFFFSVLTLLAGATVANANILVDGTFESNNTDLGGPGSHPTSFISPTTNASGAWTLVMNQPDLTGADAGMAQTGRFQQSLNGGFMDNNGDTGRVGIWFRANEGNQDPGDIPADAEFSQAVAASQGPYQLTFWEMHEENFTATTAEVAMDFYSGGASGSLLGSSVFNLLTSPPSRLNVMSGQTAPPPVFDKQTLLGNAPSGTDTLVVRATMIGGVNNPGTPGFTNFQSLTMDDFVLTIPEPTSLALVGLSFVGFSGMRRR